jgi:hypothetical protein
VLVWLRLDYFGLFSLGLFVSRSASFHKKNVHKTDSSAMLGFCFSVSGELSCRAIENTFTQARNLFDVVSCFPVIFPQKQAALFMALFYLA